MAQPRRIAAHNSSHLISASIVAVVILANIIGWVLPVLTGSSRVAAALDRTAMKASPIATGAIRAAPEFQPIRPAAQSPITSPPLSTNAPKEVTVVPLPGKIVRPAVKKVTVVVTPPARPSKDAGEPVTLYPLKSADQRPDEPATSVPVALKTRAPATEPVVLASAYAPGVRVNTGEASSPAPSRKPAVGELSTFGVAQSIAQRAAKRFDELRLQSPQALPTSSIERRSQQTASVTTLPVAMGLPRIVTSPHGARDRAHLHYVRKRLVRRPTGRLSAQRLPPPMAHPAAAERQTIATLKTPLSTPSNRDSLTVATPHPARTKLKKRAARSRTKRLRRTAKSRSIRRQRARAIQRRIAASHSARRGPRRPRRIRGFRPDFYRQLASVGFFGNR